MQHLLVSCAIIFKNNKILAAKRSYLMTHSGFWEFPGGKIENNESPEDCIIREIKEELNCEIVIKNRLPEFTHDYSSHTVTLIPFLCIIKKDSNEPKAKEHEKIKWVEKNNLSSINWLEADIPIQNYIQKNFRL